MTIGASGSENGTTTHTDDSEERLALDRQADRILICEDVVILTFGYGEKTIADALKPYVNGINPDSVFYPRMRTVSFDR
jgi:hypothetical protein